MSSEVARRPTLDIDGALCFPCAVDEPALRGLEVELAKRQQGQPGVRLFGDAKLAELLNGSGPVGAIVAPLLADATPVRAILFDKTAEANWSLGWHQDRVIAVRERVDVDGFGPWSRKHGQLHVAPPFDLLARMLTLRLHLDDVVESNAPLLVAPGSHRLGPIPETTIPDVVRRCGALTCTGARGTAWVYSTPILHCSASTHTPRHRRVLQVDYSADELPAGLRWQGMA